jgi:uncharacterized membrane protein
VVGSLHLGSAVTAAFLASLVEAVEALTIVLAVAMVRGWRPAGLGALAGLASLALIVIALGPLLDRVPLNLLQLAIGILLLLFGMRWLRKAILRAAGMIALHDEVNAFERTAPWHARIFTGTGVEVFTFARTARCSTPPAPCTKAPHFVIGHPSSPLCAGIVGSDLV